MSKTNEWNLIKREFDQLARDDGAGQDSVELDADFHRRFAALMNRVCGPSKYYQKPILSRTVPTSERRERYFIDLMRPRSKK